MVPLAPASLRSTYATFWRAYGGLRSRSVTKSPPRSAVPILDEVLLAYAQTSNA